MSVEQRVQSHFHADAARFDAIYEDAKGPLKRWIDGVWRGVVRRRYELTLQQLAPLTGKTVLDVGCGSGRYGVACARLGASRIVGVDFAPGMIELARVLAQAQGVLERCDFRVGTFPEAVKDGPFDASLALGFFDYVAQPLPLLRQLRELTRQTIILSFPKAWEWRAPLRRLRFWFNRCPLFLYGERQVRDLLQGAGLTRYDWVNLDRDYFVIAHCAAHGEPSL